MINYTYGILKGNNTIPEDATGFRFSTAVPNDKQLTALKELYSLDLSVLPLALDFYIKLLKCSPYWSGYEKTYDPDNTYHIEVIPTKDLPTYKVPNIREILVNWDNKHAPDKSVFKYSSLDPFPYRVSAKILTILTQNSTSK